MQRALTIARRGLGRTAPNPSVGAVVFDPLRRLIVGEGVTADGGRPHAEPLAIAAAGSSAHGATMAVTLEPCSHFGRSPPCADAIVSAGLGRVIYALLDPDPRVSGRGLARLRAAGIEAVPAGADFAEQARWQMRGHILRMTERRPFVQIKIAVDRTGQIAEGRSGRPAWVTGALARRRGHLLRAEADAIVVGSGTVAADDPSLDCRLEGLQAHSPVRVVIGRAALPPAGKLYRAATSCPSAGPPVWHITALNAAPAHASGEAWANGERIVAPLVGGRIWLPAAMDALVARGITRVLIEGGPRLWQAFAGHKLVDEIVVFQARAPHEDGGHRRAEPHDAIAAAQHAINRYCRGLNLVCVDHHPLGRDDMTIWRVPLPTLKAQPI
ncbi:MAG: bifunctional diaminohydroxyphosphoribosylaminopyrimidine deaminase/5-amino-6-(5-phosphoribosylamino)uracil reductase RibD [Hyphomicrobiaceae bacterium]